MRTRIEPEVPSVTPTRASNLVRSLGIFRARDIATAGYSRAYLRRLVGQGQALTSAFKSARCRGGTVRVYAPARIAADCLKYRHKYGLDIAIAALRDTWREKKFTMNELSKAAAVCRVSRGIQVCAATQGAAYSEAAQPPLGSPSAATACPGVPERYCEVVAVLRKIPRQGLRKR